MASSPGHRPVLLEEALAGLAVEAGGAYVDATYGRGGHADAILGRLGPDGRLLVIDRDPEAVAHARQRYQPDGRVRIARGDFTMLGTIAAGHAPREGFSGILLDLGVSSPQLDAPERGFSFRHDGPLDMRMDPQQGEPASQWLAEAPAEDIEQVLRVLGEERFARRIARAIVRERAREPIETTGRLADVIAEAVPRRERDRHPATRSFQAIRMHVNRELEALDAALAAVPDLLARGGRLAVISFHSLEDRRVKRFIRAASGERANVARDKRGQPMPVRDEPAPSDGPTLRSVGRPATPSEDELMQNPRARSARLRVAERVA